MFLQRQHPVASLSHRAPRHGPPAEPWLRTPPPVLKIQSRHSRHQSQSHHTQPAHNDRAAKNKSKQVISAAARVREKALIQQQQDRYAALSAAVHEQRYGMTCVTQRTSSLALNQALRVCMCGARCKLATVWWQARNQHSHEGLTQSRVVRACECKEGHVMCIHCLGQAGRVEITI
jgi:hypothetical protein